MEKYYTQEERIAALEAAKKTLDSRGDFKYGHKDCISLALEYDKNLREHSSYPDLIDFTWESIPDFLNQLRKKGMNLEDFAKAGNYKVITDNRPKVGDVAYYKGIAVCDHIGWVSVDETYGVKRFRPLLPLERGFSLIVRPLRS